MFVMPVVLTQIQYVLPRNRRLRPHVFHQVTGVFACSILVLVGVEVVKSCRMAELVHYHSRHIVILTSVVRVISQFDVICPQPRCGVASMLRREFNPKHLLTNMRGRAGRGSVVGLWVAFEEGLGVGYGVIAKGEIRSMSKSPLCQGWSETDHVRVPAVESSVAEETARERDTEPSSSMKSSLWPEREA